MAKGQAKQLSNEQRNNIINMVVRRGKRLLKQDRIDRMKRPGRKVIHSIPVKNLVERFLQSTLKECKIHIESETDSLKTPSLTTIDRILDERKVSMKAVSVVPPRRNTAETKEKRRLYATAYLSLRNRLNFGGFFRSGSIEFQHAN